MIRYRCALTQQPYNSMPVSLIRDTPDSHHLEEYEAILESTPVRPPDDVAVEYFRYDPQHDIWHVMADIDFAEAGALCDVAEQLRLAYGFDYDSRPPDT